MTRRCTTSVAGNRVTRGDPSGHPAIAPGRRPDRRDAERGCPLAPVGGAVDRGAPVVLMPGQLVSGLAGFRRSCVHRRLGSAITKEQDGGWAVMTADVFSLMDEWGPENVVWCRTAGPVFRGVLLLDNTARGMGKGGTRMSPTLTVREVARLARAMTWKWAAVDLFHGGAKAGILGDPSAPDKEGILRAFARALRNEVPAEYVFGLDMGLTEQDAAVLLDELGDRGAAVGLPRALGGLPYDELGVTGFGVAEAADAAAAVIDLPIAGATVAIQGFGAVGQAAAERFVELGAIITAVSTACGAVLDPAGVDVARLALLRSEVGDDCVREYGGAVPA